MFPEGMFCWSDGEWKGWQEVRKEGSPIPIYLVPSAIPRLPIFSVENRQGQDWKRRRAAEKA